jgi:hypothetical protein
MNLHPYLASFSGFDYIISLVTHSEQLFLSQRKFEVETSQETKMTNKHLLEFNISGSFQLSNMKILISLKQKSRFLIIKIWSNVATHVQ